jgi:hypothetical protein
VGIVFFAVLVSLSAALILFKPLDLTLNALTIAGLVSPPATRKRDRPT